MAKQMHGAPHQSSFLTINRAGAPEITPCLLRDVCRSVRNVVRRGQRGKLSHHMWKRSSSD
eukprot:3721455-Amphidinium_carterae.1